MGDYAIRMQFDIAADPGDVEQALTTREGIASWWSSKVEGSPEADGRALEVSFPDVPRPFDFSVARSGGGVEWAVGSQPEWWQGTTVAWVIDANPDGPGTRLRFRHRDFDSANPIIDIVTPAWAQIIGRLKAYVETGEPQPFFDLG